MKRILLYILLSIIFSSAIHAQFNVQSNNPPCNGLCIGSAWVLPTGSYHYQWSDGDTSQTAMGLCAGVYYVTVTDPAYNPLDTLTVFITEPAPLVLSGNSINVTCFGGTDGSITVIASGGTPAYTYTWSNGQNTQNLTNAPAGAYTVTVTDMNGCTATGTYVIVQPTPIAITLTATNATGCSVCDGSIITSVAGGSAPYTYMWNNGSTTQNQVGLCVGIYALTLVDANGCSASAAAAISAANNLSATVVTDSITCTHPISNCTLTISGGGGLYFVQWGDGTQDSSYNNVIVHQYTTPGNHPITYSDSSTCSNTLSNAVPDGGIHVASSPVNPTCANPTGGSVRVFPSNGSSPYFYLWNTGATTDSIGGLSTGNYWVTITDSTGCQNVFYNSLFNVSSNFTAYAYGTSASCLNSGIGSATIYASGGTGGYTYLWGTTPPQTTQVATSITPGVYSFTVTDGTGCSVVNSANIYFTSYSFYAYVYTTISPNCGSSNGALEAQVLGGTPPYSYHWSNSQTTPVDSGLAAGTYHLTVTDAGGCSATGIGYLQGTCYNTISGNIFADTNGNCLLDSGETAVNSIYVYASNGNITEWGYAYNGGNYSITVHDTGTFTITAINYNYGSCGSLTPCGNVNQTVTFHNFNNISSNNNFGFQGSNGFDLYLHPGWSSANPGFAKDYWVFYGNQSYQNFTGAATITFHYDANLTYNSCDPPLPAHNLATHTLTWNVNGVSSWDLRGHCHFTVSPSTPAGYHLQNDFWISPTLGDCDSSNNHYHYSELVTSSQDPNEKEVEPAGAITEDDSVLTYTIHFQNTGTDTTWFIIVKDTLSAGLDVASIRNIASSHTYTEFNVSGPGILTWVFNPIFLVDSATNESASKGFVKFSVNKKKNLPVGTSISNRASIVFDYNQPLLTNTVADTLAEPNFIFELRGMERVTVSAAPNPFSSTTTITVDGLKEKFDFSLFDVTGRMLKSISSIETKQFELNRGTLPAGVYFYKLSTYEKKVANGKLVVE